MCHKCFPPLHAVLLFFLISPPLFWILIIIPGSQQYFLYQAWPFVVVYFSASDLIFFFFNSQCELLCQMIAHKILMEKWMMLFKIMQDYLRATQYEYCMLTVGYKELDSLWGSTFSLQAGTTVFGYAVSTVLSHPACAYQLTLFPFPPYQK